MPLLKASTAKALLKNSLARRKNKNRWIEYRDRPVEFIQEILGKTLTPDQSRICESVRDRRETLVPSSHGQGKTAIAAWLLLWWVLAREGLCITSAPTGRQVKELLWGEVRSAYAPFAGDKGQQFFRVSETARAYGFASADYNANSFQGIHANPLLIILDEACGISQTIWDGAKSCATGRGDRFLAIGNPVTIDTPFEKAILSNPDSAIALPAFRHPNVAIAYEYREEAYRLKPEYESEATWEELEENNPHYIEGAISIRWIEEARKKGTESPYWVSRVEAKFPYNADFALIPRAELEKARDRFPLNPPRGGNIRHGVDVGDGGDAHAIVSFRGDCLFFAEEYPCFRDLKDTTRLARIAAKHNKKYPGILQIDRIGVGAGTLATLLDRGENAKGIHWGETSQKDEFLNLKAEQYWAFREGLKNETIAIAPLGKYEEQLFQDLSQTYYEITPQGKIKIEDKEKTKKRLGRSPNLGDAAVYAYSQPRRNMLYT